jgi:hypothetical protein
VISVEHTSASDGDHRLITVEDSSNRVPVRETFDEIHDPNHPDTMTVVLSRGSATVRGVFVVGAATNYSVTVNGGAPTQGTFPAAIGRVADADLQGALNHVPLQSAQGAGASRTADASRSALLDWRTCAIGCGVFVEIEGPFVLACMAVCLGISSN